MRRGAVGGAGGCFLGVLHKLLGREFQHPSVVGGVSSAVVGGQRLVWGKLWTGVTLAWARHVSALSGHILSHEQWMFKEIQKELA